LKKIILASVVTIVFFSACGGQSQSREDVEAFRAAFLAGEYAWEDVIARAAKEGVVEFYHWGGSEALNSWMEVSLRPAIESYGVTLNLRRADTRDVVEIILADQIAGRGLGEGTVDFVWINGENFQTLKEQGALFGPFADRLPNSQFFALDAEDPLASVNLFDFGTPTELKEMPWASFQFIFRIDSARISRETIPATFTELEAWMQLNPGRFTYVAPPHYIGTTFVQTLMYEKNPDGTTFEPFLRAPADLGLNEFIRLTEPAFAYLRRIEPWLLGQGSPVYPATAGALQARFVGGEIDFDMEYGVYDTERDIRMGIYPETVENIVIPSSGMITDKSFLAIPANAPNPAAALVAINVLSSPESQLSKLVDIGYAPGLDVPLLATDVQAQFQDSAPDLRGVTAEELSQKAVPNVNAAFVDIIDSIWLEYIGESSQRSFSEIVTAVWGSVVP
jgi:putative spermidine/putrescine transport system substrate-binding protein